MERSKKNTVHTSVYKHSTIIRDYDAGGLKMTDIQSMMMALRLSRISRLLEDKKWHHLINIHLKNTEDFCTCWTAINAMMVLYLYETYLTKKVNGYLLNE